MPVVILWSIELFSVLLLVCDSLLFLLRKSFTFKGQADPHLLGILCVEIDCLVSVLITNLYSILHFRRMLDSRNAYKNKPTVQKMNRRLLQTEDESTVGASFIPITAVNCV